MTKGWRAGEAHGTGLFPVLLCGWMLGISCIVSAEVYVWIGPDGVQNFSDSPPEQGLYERRGSDARFGQFQAKSRELAIMWFHAGPYGGRCDLVDMRRIEQMYHDLRIQARQELHFCKEGVESSCLALGIPMHVAILNSERSLYSYLPPADIRLLKESGYATPGSRSSCR